MGKREISFKARVDQQTVINYLEDLLEGLRAGAAYVQSGNEYVTLKPTSAIDMEVEAVQKKDKQRVSIELSWNDEQPVEKPRAELRITTTEPEIEIVDEDQVEKPTPEPEQQHY